MAFDHVVAMDVEIFWNECVYKTVNFTQINTRLVKKCNKRHPHGNSIGTKHKSLCSAADYRAQGGTLYWLYKDCLHSLISSMHSKNLVIYSWCLICAFNAKIININTSMWTSFYINCKNGCSLFEKYLMFDSVNFWRYSIRTWFSFKNCYIFAHYQWWCVHWLRQLASAASVYKGSSLLLKQ